MISEECGGWRVADGGEVLAGVCEGDDHGLGRCRVRAQRCRDVGIVWASWQRSSVESSPASFGLMGAQQPVVAPRVARCTAPLAPRLTSLPAARCHDAAQPVHGRAGHLLNHHPADHDQGARRLGRHGASLCRLQALPAHLPRRCVQPAPISRLVWWPLVRWLSAACTLDLSPRQSTMSR